MAGKIKLEDVEHICVLVKDIEKTKERINQVFDIPPIKIEDYTSTATLKGKEVGKYKVRLAFLQIAPNLKLELLQISEGKSVEQKWLKEHGETMHHIAVKADNIEKTASEWEKKGLRILQEDGGKWIYLDAEKLFGFNFEIIPTEGF